MRDNGKKQNNNGSGKLIESREAWRHAPHVHTKDTSKPSDKYPIQKNTIFVTLPHQRTVSYLNLPSWLAGHRSCTVWPGWSSAGSAVDSLCSTGAPWPAAQCTRTQSAEVYTETEGRQDHSTAD